MWLPINLCCMYIAHYTGNSHVAIILKNEVWMNFNQNYFVLWQCARLKFLSLCSVGNGYCVFQQIVLLLHASCMYYRLRLIVFNYSLTGISNKPFSALRQLIVVCLNLWRLSVLSASWRSLWAWSPITDTKLIFN